MKLLLVNPSPWNQAPIFLRLEPIGLELVAQAARAAGHAVRLLDLQIFGHADYFRELDAFGPQAVGFCLNYLPHVPEVIDLAAATKRRRPDCFIFVGGHSASFIAPSLLRHVPGAIDCVVRGEGEAITPRLLEAIPHGNLESLPGIVTLNGAGPGPELIPSLEQHRPARDLARKRRKYFIGRLDPCASIEFTRGCPWDCVFCSAWTFYGRSYRKISPEVIAEDLAQIQEPHVFIVDDVAFIHPEDGFAIGREIERRNIRKLYYLETRADVLIRNREVFAYWKRLGLTYMFLGLEALDEEGLKLHRKRVAPSENFKALEIARSLGISPIVNVIADPSWDENRFRIVREWALSIPEVVPFTVNTPYPGTETWYTESRQLTTHDYRLFDIHHAVLPTTLPLKRFYEELLKTQEIINRKFLSLARLRDFTGIALRLLLRGQTNFLGMFWKFHEAYNAERQYADHFREVKYALTPPPAPGPAKPAPGQLYIHLSAPVKRAAASPASQIAATAG